MLTLATCCNFQQQFNMHQLKLIATSAMLCIATCCHSQCNCKHKQGNSMQLETQCQWNLWRRIAFHCNCQKHRCIFTRRWTQNTPLNKTHYITPLGGNERNCMNSELRNSSDVNSLVCGMLEHVSLFNVAAVYYAMPIAYELNMVAHGVCGDS